MKKNSSGPLPALVSGIVVVAVLITLTVSDGWLIWIPVLAAFAVTAGIWNGLGR